MRNVKLIFEYDGTDFVGWQEQTGLRSVEHELGEALHKLTGERLHLWVAGRTDAGVHAQAQVANFRTRSVLEVHKIASGLNFYLPRDIGVHAAFDVPDDFNARVDSLGKSYRYRVYRGPQRAALETRAWHVRAPLDPEAMRAGAAHLIGELDFEAFRSASCDAPHARREMFAIDVVTTPRPPHGELVDLVFHANAFCRHMCRILAGTLLEVGRGRRRPEAIGEILHRRDRTLAGMTAPAQGLTLMRVWYPPDHPYRP